MPDRADRHGIFTAIALLAAALILRLWQLGSIPLLHDELSSLIRVDFDGFSEMIRMGVAIDAHPAFSQTLLWLWAPVAEDNKFLLRLPYVLMGWGAVIVMWRFADLSMDRFRANLVAAVLAAGQLFIYNSEMTRPYAPGMLFTALYTLAWHQYIHGEKRSVRHLVVMSLWMALATYTHYFALLTTVVIWLTGWMYARKIPKSNYALHGIFALVLFSPHLKLFFTQLGHGGIGGPDGWLRAPRIGDLTEWLLEVFNFNGLLFSIAILSWVYGLVRAVSVDRENGKFWAVLWIWLGATFFVGFAYSHLVNPVMYILPLVFALPYAVVACAWPWDQVHPAVRMAAPWSVLALMLFSLIFHRDHYGVMSKQPVQFAAQVLTERPDAFLAVESNPQFIKYTLKNQNDGVRSEPDINTYGTGISLRERAAQLADYSGEVYVGDGSGADLDYLASQRFPHVLERIEGFTFTGWIFTAGEDNRADYFSTWMRGEGPHTGNEEYYTLMNFPLDTTALTFGNEIRTAVHLGDSIPENLLLVYDLRRDGESVHWSAANVMENTAYSDYSDGYVMVKNLLLWNIFTRPEDMGGVQMSIFLWNRDQEPFTVTDFEVARIKANPNRYGLLNRRP